MKPISANPCVASHPRRGWLTCHVLWHERGFRGKTCRHAPLVERDRSSRVNSPWFQLCVFIPLLAVFISGCATTRGNQPAPVKTSIATSTTHGSVTAIVIEGGSQGGVSTDQILSNDPSVVRLQDITSVLLLYCATYRHLPASLEDLALMADPGTQLNFTSPASGRPYVYVPAGLQTPRGGKRIIVYDPALSANGKRWCILMGDSAPGKARTAEVFQMPETVFRTYQIPAP